MVSAKLVSRTKPQPQSSSGSSSSGGTTTTPSSGGNGGSSDGMEALVVLAEETVAPVEANHLEVKTV